MSDAVVRHHRRHPSRGDGGRGGAGWGWSSGERLAQVLLFVLMVAPSALLWSLVVHLVFYRR